MNAASVLLSLAALSVSVADLLEERGSVPRVVAVMLLVTTAMVLIVIKLCRGHSAPPPK